MFTRQEDIQEEINSMEKEITANVRFISALMTFRNISKEFDGKVLNKRFTEELSNSACDSVRIFSFKYSYNKDAVDFPVYLKERFCNNYCKYFRFPIDKCFIVTDSGKLRINAKGFSERCLEIRNDLVNENSITRSEIDSVYQMLADAQELEKQADEFNKKYSYRLKYRFKCNYRLRW